MFPRLSAALLLLPFGLCGQSTLLLNTLSEELQRNYSVLHEKADPAPYFMSYSVVEQESEVINGSFGAIQGHQRSRGRNLDVSVRVGAPEFDNYHVIKGDMPRFTAGVPIPLDDQPASIRRRLWMESDRVWKMAAQRYFNTKANAQVKLAGSDTSNDFSQAPAATETVPVTPKKDSGGWEDRVRRWSAVFAKYPAVLDGDVTLLILDETKYLVNTEGTSLRHGRNFSRIVISARGKAADGMDLSTTASFEASDPKRLPDDATVLAAVEKVAEDLKGLLPAPVVDPFIGPAILSGKASGVFFHEIFGHRVEGHRQKDDSDGQTFTKSINTPILPEFLSVIFDPTRSTIGKVDLNGTYTYDDEGVKARAVTVVDKGVLKTFLMSRTPIAAVGESNGHGRRQAGAEVVSRQSNLIVESSKTVPDAQLRQMLIDEIKRQNKPYGLFFKDITGGFTFTGRRGLQAFKVIPLVVYRVYTDGRPDELVRGVDIVGTPLASFARILATGDKPEVFNGYCGAESGSVPVSAVSPAVLVSEIEIQRKDKSNDRPPLLPAPLSGGQ